MKLDRVIAVRTNKTVYRDGDRCIKVFGTDFTKTDVLAEALHQAHMEVTGLPVPCVLEVTPIDGKWAIVSEYIKGQSLAQLMEKNPDRLGEYVDLFASLQNRIFDARVCQGLNSLESTLAQQLITCEHIHATTRYGLHRRLNEMPREMKDNRLCHGDFEPSNITIAEDGTPYILDWSHVTYGPSEADMALTYLLLAMRYGAETAEDYLERVTREESIRVCVRRWLPIIAAARSVESNEADRAFLLPYVKN